MVSFTQFFSSNAEADIFLEGSQNRKHKKIEENSFPVFSVNFNQHEEVIKGVIIITLKRGKSLEHQGMKIEIIGTIGKIYTETGTGQ